MSTSLRILPLLTAATFVVGVAAQSPTSLRPSKDNTLIESASGALSNGKGPIFAGRTKTAGIRRALLHFDVAQSVPKGARITAAQLTVRVTKSVLASPTLFALYAVQDDWGEGSSATTGGNGVPATVGDATWTHRFWQTQTWKQAGGDFDSTALSTQNLSGLNGYTFPSTPAFVAAVQLWLDNPTQNFGIVLRGGEQVGGTAKQIASREDPTLSARPELRISWVPGVPAAVQPTGTGCGVASVLNHAANGLPRLGNLQYQLQGSSGPAAGIAVTCFSGGLSPVPIPLGTPNCNLYIDLGTLFLAVPGAFDAQGSTALPFGIPNVTGYMGVQITTQIVSFDTTFMIGSSNALTHTLGT